MIKSCEARYVYIISILLKPEPLPSVKIEKIANSSYAGQDTRASIYDREGIRLQRNREQMREIYMPYKVQ